MASVDFVTRVINFWEALIEKRKNEPCKKLVVEYDVAGGNYTLATEKVEYGDTQIITTICAYVDGGSPDLLRVGRAFQRNLFWQESKNTPADGELVYTSTTSVLQGGDYIVAYFENVPAGSDIYLMTSCMKPVLPFLYPRLIEDDDNISWGNVVLDSVDTTNPTNVLGPPDGNYATMGTEGYIEVDFDNIYEADGFVLYHDSAGVTREVDHGNTTVDCWAGVWYLDTLPTGRLRFESYLAEVTCVGLYAASSPSFKVDAIGLLNPVSLE